MKSIQLTTLLILSSLVLVGCTKKVENTTTAPQAPTQTLEPLSSPESMMNAPLATPVVQATPVDISTDTALKSTKPVSTSDEPKSIQTDLTNTTIVGESFN